MTPATEKQVTYIAALAEQVEAKFGYASISNHLYRATQRARFNGLTKGEAWNTITALKRVLATEIDTP